MGIELAKAYINVRADGSKLRPDLQGMKAQTQSALGGMASMIRGIIGPLMAGVGIMAIRSFLSAATRLAETQIDAEQRLAAVIKATSGAAGFSAEELKKWASEMQGLTTFGDEVIMGAAAKLLTFKAIQGDVFKSTMKAAMDLAANGFGNLDSNILQLGKAIENPIKGMTMLTRVGVSLTDQQMAEIKALQKSGDLRRAQVMLLAAVEGQVKGIAEEMAKTDVGKIKQAANVWGDMKEEVGKVIIQIKASLAPRVVALAGTISRVAKAVQKAFKGREGLIVVLGLATTAVGILAMAFAALKITAVGVIRRIQFALIGTGWGAIIVAVGVAIGLVVLGVMKLIKWLGTLVPIQDAMARGWDRLLIAWENIKAAASTVWNAIVTVIRSAVENIAEAFGISMDSMPSTAAEALSSVIDKFTLFVLNISEWIRAIAENWREVWAAMPEIIKLAVLMALDIWVNWVRLLPQIIGFGLRKVFDVWLAYWGLMLKVVAKVVEGIARAVAQIPGMIMKVLAGKDLGDVLLSVMKGTMEQITGLVKGLEGEAPDMDKLFDFGEGTLEQIDKVKGALGGVLARKKELEGMRVGKGEGEEGEGGKEAVKDAVAAGTEKGLLAAGRYGIADIGKRVQDALLKQIDPKEKKLGQMVGIGQAGLKKQDDLLAAVKEGNAKPKPAVLV